MLHTIVDIFLHLDRHLGEFVQAHGSSTYAFLFAIIFLETGVVVTPFLPGDSLLFACGALAKIDYAKRNADHLAKPRHSFEARHSRNTIHHGYRSGEEESRDPLFPQLEQRSGFEFL